MLEPDDTIALMKAITPERCQQELQEQGGTDFGFEFGTAGRFRTSVFQQKGNITVVLRMIPSKLLSFEDIGLPPIVKSLCRRPRGMFLVTGPTGSGKTTTLATMMNYVNEHFDKHIVTVEDPIEYYHSHKKSMINQREVGVDVPSFSERLHACLRMDPDVVMVGELRDLETIEAALRAAETGHLVFGTLHTTRRTARYAHHRPVPGGPAGADPRAAFGVADRGVVPGAGAPEGHPRAGGGIRVHGGHQRYRQPDPREQGLSHPVLDTDRKETGHAVAGRPHVPAVLPKGRYPRRTA